MNKEEAIQVIKVKLSNVLKRDVEQIEWEYEAPLLAKYGLDSMLLIEFLLELEKDPVNGFDMVALSTEHLESIDALAAYMAGEFPED